MSSSCYDRQMGGFAKFCESPSPELWGNLLDRPSWFAQNAREPGSIQVEQQMGADFNSHRVFVGECDATRCRDAALAEMRRFFQQRGLKEVAREDDAVRSIVVGAAERWIFVGDSAGSTEWADPEGFDALSRA